MDRKGALWYHVNPIILLVIDPCCDPLRTGLLLHPYGWLTRQLQLAAQVPYASFTPGAAARVFSHEIQYASFKFCAAGAAYTFWKLAFAVRT